MKKLSGIYLTILLCSVFLIYPSFTAAQMSCTPQCSGQCPDPKASQYSFSYYMRIGEIRWDATKGTFWSDPGGGCATWSTPPNLTAYCSQDYYKSIKPTMVTCPNPPFVDSGRYCINGGGGGCLPPTPGPTLGPAGTLGPEPSLQSVPIDDPNKLEIRYCAYQGEDNLPICICGSQADEVVLPDGTIDIGSSCVQTKFCIENPGKCTRVADYQCTGEPPFGQEGTVTNQKIEDFGDLIAVLFVWSLSILGVSLFAMIIYAATEWILAAGNPGKISRAKGRIYNAILGAVLLLCSFLILNFINPRLVQNAVNFEILGTPAPPRPTPAMKHTDCWI